MSATPYPDLNALATHFRNELAPPAPQSPKKFILLYAYNGTGKTRLSTAFKDMAKQAGQPDTLYFNAFTEDLFSWHNDLVGDSERYLILHPSCNFFAGLEELEMDNRIRPLLQRYADFDFRLDTVPVKDEQGKVRRQERIVRFSREVVNGGSTTTVDNIKISRGEENIFIWCFFLAIVRLAMDDDGTGPYKWVKNIYIDDPISSLDEHNAIVVANHLVQLFRETPNQLKTVISTHHILFFNVLSNEIKNLLATREFPQYCLNRDRTGGGYKLYRQKSDTPFFHHVASLVELYEAAQKDEIYTHHFNTLRSVLEKTAVFHGYGHFSACIKKDPNDADGILHQRFIDLLSHGKYSLYEPKEMGDETRDYFRTILYGFLKDYPFNPALFPTAAPAAPAPAPAKAQAKAAKKSATTLLNEWDMMREQNPAKKPSFDAIVANPPFSYRWEPTDALADDVRFKSHGLAPKSAADFAFLLHGFHFLKDEGVMAIILPHGVLFRGGAEERIRTKLLKDGHIDTVIGLPANLFYSTGIPVCILVLKKCKKPDDVLFINAAEHFVKGKRQNQLSEEHIAKIIATYQFRNEEPRYSRRVEMAEVEKNGFNLNISRYISTAVGEEEISLEETNRTLVDIEDAIKTATSKHNEFLKELGVPLLPTSDSNSSRE